MNAKELRIGNLVDLYGQVETIYAIRNSGVDFYRGKTKKSVIMQSYVWEAIKPIQLTEEWLNKLGLKKIEEYCYELDNIHINTKRELIWIFTKCKRELEFNIPDYIHELQNLYFALTNEELTLKT